MNSIRFKCTELFIIFILVPISFTIPYLVWVKLAIGVLGFLYIIFVLLKVEKNTFKMSPNLNWKRFWKKTGAQFLVIAFITTLYVYFVDSSQLFNVLLNNPKLWIFILFFYSLFSVYPQELIYRTFFFQRYQTVFKNRTVFIILNAALFSLAHIFFKSTLVMILTFIGGILFALTFYQTKSTLLVSIEHALYGCWLFTVGMGEMLGFPS